MIILKACLVKKTWILCRFLWWLTNLGMQIDRPQIGQVYEYFWPPTVQYPAKSLRTPARSGILN